MFVQTVLRMCFVQNKKKHEMPSYYTDDFDRVYYIEVVGAVEAEEHVPLIRLRKHFYQIIKNKNKYESSKKKVCSPYHLCSRSARERGCPPHWRFADSQLRINGLAALSFFARLG